MYLRVRPIFLISVLQVLSVLNLGMYLFSATRKVCVALMSMLSYFCCSCEVHTPCLAAFAWSLVAANTRNYSLNFEVTACIYLFLLLGIVDLSNLEVGLCGISGVCTNKVCTSRSR